MLFVLVVGTDVCNKSEAFFGNCFRNMCLTFAKTRFYGFRSRSEFSLLILEVSFSVNILVEKMTLECIFKFSNVFPLPALRSWMGEVGRQGWVRWYTIDPPAPLCPCNMYICREQILWVIVNTNYNSSGFGSRKSVLKNVVQLPWFLKKDLQTIHRTFFLFHFFTALCSRQILDCFDF
jgi:hypothetical protein